MGSRTRPRLDRTAVALTRSTKMELTMMSTTRPRALNGVLRLASSLAIFIGVLSASPTARAQSDIYDLSGRWTSKSFHYVVDIGKCGTEWCGVRVNTDQSCGGVVLRIAYLKSQEPYVLFQGTLDLQPEIEPYHVVVSLESLAAAPVTAPTEVTLLGNPNRAPDVMTRVISLSDRLVRGGDAQCKAEPKMS